MPKRPSFPGLARTSGKGRGFLNLLVQPGCLVELTQLWRRSRVRGPQLPAPMATAACYQIVLHSVVVFVVVWVVVVLVMVWVVVVVVVWVVVVVVVVVWVVVAVVVVSVVVAAVEFVSAAAFAVAALVLAQIVVVVIWLDDALAFASPAVVVVVASARPGTRTLLQAAFGKVGLIQVNRGNSSFCLQSAPVHDWCHSRLLRAQFFSWRPAVPEV